MEFDLESPTTPARMSHEQSLEGRGYQKSTNRHVLQDFQNIRIGQDNCYSNLRNGTMMHRQRHREWCHWWL